MARTRAAKASLRRLARRKKKRREPRRRTPVVRRPKLLSSRPIPPDNPSRIARVLYLTDLIANTVRHLTATWNTWHDRKALRCIEAAVNERGKILETLRATSAESWTTIVTELNLLAPNPTAEKGTVP